MNGCVMTDLWPVPTGQSPVTTPFKLYQFSG
jgi:hypothetical protein